MDSGELKIENGECVLSAHCLPLWTLRYQPIAIGFSLFQLRASRFRPNIWVVPMVLVSCTSNKPR